MCKEILKALCMPQNDYFTCIFVIIQIPRPKVIGKLNHIYIFFTLRESKDLARR